MPSILDGDALGGVTLGMHGDQGLHKDLKDLIELIRVGWVG